MCPPSDLTLIGLVRHLVGVENWFHRFDDEPELDPHTGEEAFVPEPDHVARDLGSYRTAVERSRRAVAGRALEDVIDLPHWVGYDRPRRSVQPP
ncbi:MAG: DinB family protein, partial [Actinomycetota bacterium]|nr:DinB family protein [Actinomycetota bacterium]